MSIHNDKLDLFNDKLDLFNDKLDLIDEIDLDNLLNFIIKFINSLNSSVIYFGVGTHFYDEANISEWEDNNNQQFPLFLNDFKSKYFDIPILIILIDPSFKKEPYLVSKCKNFLHGSWNISNKYSNLFLSELGVSVVRISKHICWGFEKENCYNIENLLIKLSIYISQPQINSLLFYHEFIGTNTIKLEKIILQKSFEQINLNKVCIDITRGSDTSCYFNLSNPNFYPVIVFDDNKLKYKNPNLIDLFEKKNILSKYILFTKGFYSESNISYNTGISKFNKNILFDKPDEMILCFQIINQDNLNICFLIDFIIPLIRQFYSNGEHNQYIIKNGIKNLNYFIGHIDLFEYKNFNKNYVELLENLNLIEILNNNRTNLEENPELKNKCLYNLYLILKNIVNFIFIKYDFKINEFIINNFIDKLKDTDDKYNIMFIFNDFIKYNFYMNL